MIDFYRIAILDPLTTYGQITPDLNTKSAKEATKRWLHLAKSNGADSCYLRMHTVSNESLLSLVSYLKPSFSRIIAPGSLGQVCPNVVLHFRELESDYDLQGKNQLRGKSCHSLSSALKAQEAGLDYIFVSPVFETKSHPNTPALGIKKFQGICQRVSVPVFALGGVSKKNEQSCLDAGAHGVAAISMFLECS